MGIIERTLTISNNISSKRILAMFDSGSSFSIVKSNVIRHFKDIKINHTDVAVTLGDGSKIHFNKSVLLKLKMNKNYYYHDFLVGDIPEQMIIGVDFLQKYGHTLEFKNDRIISKKMHLKTRRGEYVL